jgi:hypothetical protein
MRCTAFALVLAVTSFGRGSHAAPPTPVLVELFTSEGCSDCPPADTLLQKLIDTQPVGGAEIIGLGQHVDYWDRQGWKDRFSSAALTSRQRTYSTRFGGDSIYTPQMVVDGRAEFVGSDAAAARRAIEHARTVAHGVVGIELSGAGAERGHERAALHVSVTASDLPKSGRGDRADLILVVTEDQLRSDVKRGENQGRVLTHAAVVRYLATIGEAGAAPVRADIALSPEWQRDHLKIVAFVQEAQSRAILASAAAPLKNARP